ncbi:hypothetical protein HHI36_013180 [Cryptolaemus montrouzieri]|uniref:Secreted protein n=1 Tax=Cryptolaemus montrouzieri TaxID=559131 RepID=A0ABD2NGW0_9CUCU
MFSECVFIIFVIIIPSYIDTGRPFIYGINRNYPLTRCRYQKDTPNHTIESFTKIRSHANISTSWPQKLLELFG